MFELWQVRCRESQTLSSEIVFQAHKYDAMWLYDLLKSDKKFRYVRLYNSEFQLKSETSTERV